MSRFQSLNIGEFLLLIGVHSESVASPRIGTWRRLGNLVADPPDSFPCSSSRDSFPALSIYQYHIISLVIHMFVRSGSHAVITLYLDCNVGMYITTVLPYSDS